MTAHHEQPPGAIRAFDTAFRWRCPRCKVVPPIDYGCNCDGSWPATRIDISWPDDVVRVTGPEGEKLGEPVLVVAEATIIRHCVGCHLEVLPARETRRVHIVSPGAWLGTTAFDAVTGERISEITSVVVDIAADGHATSVIVGYHGEIVNGVRQTKLCRQVPHCGGPLVMAEADE